MATLREWACATLSGGALAAAVLAAAPTASAAPDQVPGAPCYNGIAPFNPYIDNCAIPNRPPHILGAAPDQTAILNCNFGSGAWRAVCLSQFVNGGPYPGIAVGFG
jgi:hypothetical protein